MKVALINHSDTRGGAAVVTLRLTHALRERGVDATMVVGRKESPSPYVVAGSQCRRRLGFIAEHLDIVSHNSLSRNNMFKISTGRHGMGLDRLPQVREADIIVPAWINQGVMSLGELKRLADMGKKIVWVMHDRWCQTGICHHLPDAGCRRLSDGCGMCPLLVKPHDNDLSRDVFAYKRKMFNAMRESLHFVAVSRWLAESEPGALTGHHVDVIPNAFPVDEYDFTPTISRGELNLPEDLPLIVMGAARLDDPIKNLPMAVTALNAIRMPAAAVFFGALKDPHALDALTIPHVHLGSIADSHRVAQIMAYATVVLSSSLFETLPTTLIEGMAAGATPVTTGKGGQRDIIDDGIDGYISPDNDPATIAMLIDRAIYEPFDREAQHRATARRFDSQVIAKRYTDLFDSILQK